MNQIDEVQDYRCSHLQPGGELTTWEITDTDGLYECSQCHANGRFVLGKMVAVYENEFDPNGLAANVPGAKLDAGKAPIWEYFFEAFPRSMELLALIGIQGNEKYSKNGWHQVPDGFNRYSNAMGRHQIEEAKGEALDPKTGYPHAGHTAWNALARLERMLMTAENKPVTVVATERHVSGRNDLSGVYGSSPDRVDETVYPHKWKKEPRETGSGHQYHCEKCGDEKWYTDPNWAPPAEGCKIPDADLGLGPTYCKCGGKYKHHDSIDGFLTCVSCGDVWPF